MLMASNMTVINVYANVKYVITCSDGRFPYSKSKIEIFSQNQKKSKSRFYNKLVHRFLLTWNTFIFDRDNVTTCW